MLASFQRSKHLWCLISKHKAIFGCFMLAYLNKQAQIEASKQRLPYACLLSTKGAYYVGKKQA
jgi:hypothetical protein